MTKVVLTIEDWGDGFVMRLDPSPQELRAKGAARTPAESQALAIVSLIEGNARQLRELGSRVVSGTVH
jgi:hypothetical protein